MIITDKITIKITYRNITHFKKLGYNDININDNINVNPSELFDNSPVIISAMCDTCYDINEIQYRTYIHNIKYDGNYYCKKCCHIKSKNTKKEKYGDENYNNIEKRINTNISKYGHTHHNKLKIFTDKIKKTKKEKYGDENYNNVIKSKNTKKEKYGDENYNNQDKLKETLLNRYGVDSIMKLESNRKKIKISKTEKIINKYKDYNIIDIDYDNYEFIYKCTNHISKIPKTIFYNRLATNTSLCTVCNPINDGKSDIENKLLEFIKDNYNGDIITNSRNIIKPYEIDIYLPELNLAFEFNGLYWHNELNKPKNYHKIKSDLCSQKNIQLIHVWEDEWVYKQNIVKSIILNKLGKNDIKVYGRKTIIKEISNNKIIKDFLDKNHIQGFVNSLIKIGLYYDNELVSLMTFGKKRLSMNNKSINNDYEMLRFCNKLNTSVIGGASKLFKYFLTTYNPDEVISYADRSYSNGNLYKQLGLKFIHTTEPNYYYVINNMKKYRFNFRKDILVKQGYDKNKTEHEIMLDRKIYRIYNAGNYKFTYK